MPFDGTNFEDGRPQPGRPPSGDNAGIIVVSAALLLLPISLGSLVSIVLYLTGK